MINLKERTPEAREAYLQGYEAGKRDEREACERRAVDAIYAASPQAYEALNRIIAAIRNRDP